MVEIFNRLIKEDLMPNTYYMLHCLKEKVIPNKFVNKDLEISRLKAGDWVNDDLVLTAKSIIFTEEINSFFKKSWMACGSFKVNIFRIPFEANAAASPTRVDLQINSNNSALSCKSNSDSWSSMFC